eukprot:COSAG04_NODE_1368_length_7057_cov_2.633372_6_plen_409_part_00
MSTPLVSPEKCIALEKRLKALGIHNKDLEEKFISGQGKGGQKQNKSQNCVQLRYIPNDLIITCQAYRERERNRYRAKTQLCERIEQQESGKMLNAKQEKKKKQKERRQRRQKEKANNNQVYLADGEKIHWFPGHMAKTLQQLKEQLKRIDLVVELRDARIPLSSHNQHLNELYQHKNKIIVLSKTDLADPQQNKAWKEKLKEEEKCLILSLNLKNNKDIKILEKACAGIQTKKASSKTHALAYTTLHVLILGIPNVGKSQLINQWRKKKMTHVANRPGVTKQLNWIPIGSDILVMDSPGLLWPNLENQDQAIKLALVAAIKDTILPQEKLCHYLIEFLQKKYPKSLKKCYKLDQLAASPKEIIEQITEKRQFYLPNKTLNEDKTIKTILYDFQHEKMGRISLEEIPIN